MRVEFAQMKPDRSLLEDWDALEKQYEQSVAAPIAQAAELSAELSRLAALDDLDYELERKKVAEALGIRIQVLDKEVQARREVKQPARGGSIPEDVDPWPDPVDGAELLDEICSAARQYIVLPTGAAEAVALFVVHAHAHDASEISPILAVTSPTLECGKTVLMTFVGEVVPRRITGSNLTAATIFRAVEKYRPTLMIDEADTFLRDNDELRGVLNSGHARVGAYVLRCVGDNYEPTVFSTWAPKAIAMIGKLPATLASRSIHIELKRKAPGESAMPLRAHKLDMLLPLQRKAARWAADHLEELREHEPDIPPNIHGRAADNWRSLFSIADVAGGMWPQRARRAARILSARTSEQTAGIVLLKDLQKLFKEGGESLSTQHILTALGAMDDKAWPEWNRGKPLSAAGLARLLKPFGIKPRSIRSGEDCNHKGYLKKQFDDAFHRYLPATPPHPGNDADDGPGTPATPEGFVADAKPGEPAADADCGGVADGEPPPADGIGNGPAINDLSEEARSVWKEIRRYISILDFSGGEVKFPGPPASRPRGRSPVPKQLQKRVLRLASELVPRLRWEATAQSLIRESTKSVNSILGLEDQFGLRVLQNAALWRSYELRLDEALVDGDMSRIRDLLDDRERYARFLADT